MTSPRRARNTAAWRFADWEPGIYSMVRFTLTDEGQSTKLVVDQDGVPADVHEHVRTNWRGFYFEPFAKHFAGLSQAAGPVELLGPPAWTGRPAQPGMT